MVVPGDGQRSGSRAPMGQGIRGRLRQQTRREAGRYDSLELVMFMQGEILSGPFNIEILTKDFSCWVHLS